MDLANLSAFIAIAETGSFSGAGERLHLTLSLIHISEPTRLRRSRMPSSA